MKAQCRQQDTSTWFSDITGLPEQEWLDQRERGILQRENGDLLIRNIQTQDIYEAGHFATHSLDELAQVSHGTGSWAPFELHIRRQENSTRSVDVAHLQANAPDRSLFQVASNFNCAEVSHPGIRMDNGYFVSKLAIDSTQGPAASASAGVSAITRIHATFYDPHTPSSSWGQTLDRQIALLGHPLLRPHFPVLNGKLWFQGREPKEFNSETLFPHIRVGLHQRVRPFFGYRQPPYMERYTHPPSIDQVFVSALNWRAPLPHNEHLRAKTICLLDAAYQGSYLCAVYGANPLLMLTLVGGGSFSNPPAFIASAIAKAHQKYGRVPSLHKVILPLYPLGGIIQREDFSRLLSEAFATQGIGSYLRIVEV